MIPESFNYKKASSIDDAIASLDEDAQLLGGGHSLIPALKLRLSMPGTLVDISKLDELKGIRDNEKSITIGAGTTHGAIADSEVLAKYCPMIPAAAQEIGDIQVRNVGTIGGSIAHADPAADWPAVLLAANATVHIRNKDGERKIDIDQFFKGFFETALEEGEIITAISIPKTAGNQHSRYEKFKQPASRFAIVGCAVAVAMNGGAVKSARVALTGVSEYAYRATSVEDALEGKTLNEETIAEAAKGATEGVSIMSDHYASETYRTHLAQVYVKRALKGLL